MSFFSLFQRWSTEVLWLIADGSGLIVDVARMVQGSSYSPIFIQIQITSEALFAYRLRCTDHARARSAAFRWR